MAQRTNHPHIAMAQAEVDVGAPLNMRFSMLIIVELRRFQYSILLPQSPSQQHVCHGTRLFFQLVLEFMQLFTTLL